VVGAAAPPTAPAATLLIAPTSTSTTTTTTTTTLPPTTTTAPPPTLAAVSEIVPGDLGIPGVAMTRPACDGSYVLMVGSAISPAFYQRDVTTALDTYPGASYLRTDQTCSSLRPDLDGNAIYSTYFGPYGSVAEACAERWRGPADAYVKVLSTTVAWNTPITC
jgi:serine/threonine-protein kinase